MTPAICAPTTAGPQCQACARYRPNGSAVIWQERKTRRGHSYRVVREVIDATVVTRAGEACPMRVVS